ncbi:RNA-directed DNA polymerase, eukaryota, partial [Tanacetum coccineum]
MLKAVPGQQNHVDMSAIYGKVMLEQNMWEVSDCKRYIRKRGNEAVMSIRLLKHYVSSVGFDYVGLDLLGDVGFGWNSNSMDKVESNTKMCLDRPGGLPLASWGLQRFIRSWRGRRREAGLFTDSGLHGKEFGKMILVRFLEFILRGDCGNDYHLMTMRSYAKLLLLKKDSSLAPHLHTRGVLPLSIDELYASSEQKGFCFNFLFLHGVLLLVVSFAVMGDRRPFNSKEDLTQKISTSVFVTNFPDHYTARDLWNVCLAYGKVIDVYIPFKKSKAGK